MIDEEMQSSYGDESDDGKGQVRGIKKATEQEIQQVINDHALDGRLEPDFMRKNMVDLKDATKDQLNDLIGAKN